MKVAILLAWSVLAAGCAAPTTSGVDAYFGQALTSAKAAQVIDPDAPSRARAAMTVDAQAVKAALDRYQKSFEAPPAPVQVFNIGVGSSGQGGGSR